MTDTRIREVRLLTAAVGSAITHDPDFFGPILEYARRLVSADLHSATREQIEELDLVVDRIETFFSKYRSDDTSLYISPSQISGSDEDLARLRALLKDLLDAPGPAFDQPTPAAGRPTSTQRREDRPMAGEGAGRRVFVVHGHELGPRDAVARLLDLVGLEPVILIDEPNRGRTIIEKFEASVDVAFAVVVMTPDDLGSSKAELEGARDGADASVFGALHPRARQNVVLELGYFIGRLGRDKVVALIAGEVERPSDVEGVLYIPYERGWEMELARELSAAGMPVDATRLLHGP